jgi:hypothetical protein
VNFATLVVIALCLIAVAVCIAAAAQIADKRGWMSPLAIGAIVAAICVTLLGAWAVWATFDDPANVNTSAGVATNAGPVTGNGNCDPACLLAALGRASGTMN